MKIKILFLLLLLSSSYLRAQETPRPDMSQIAKPHTIKVLIHKQIPEALLEVRGRYQIINMSNDLEIDLGMKSKRQIVTPHQDGVNWGSVYPGIYQMRIAPIDAESHILINGIQYRGCMEICQVNGKLQIVNEIDVESYLKSTLTSQFSEKIHEEVLQAIAIVARTNAYYTASKDPAAFWHVEARQVGYFGYGVSLHNLYIDLAVDKTRHVILTYKEHPFAATWTENSAGKTASFSSIFRKNTPSPKGVVSPFAAKMRERNSWQLALPVSKLTPLKNIIEVQTFRDKSSNKIYGLRLKSKTQTCDIPFLELQALGLKSSDFSVSLKNDQLFFKGFGEGHGVGLCLYSALALARQGSSARTLLHTFFPDTKILHCPN